MLITRRVQLLYQELATLPDHVLNNADFGEVRVDNFLVFRVVFHCFLFSPFAFVHWIVGPSLIYGKGPWWLNEFGSWIT